MLHPCPYPCQGNAPVWMDVAPGHSHTEQGSSSIPPSAVLRGPPHLPGAQKGELRALQTSSQLSAAAPVGGHHGQSDTSTRQAAPARAARHWLALRRERVETQERLSQDLEKFSPELATRSLLPCLQTAEPHHSEDQRSATGRAAAETLQRQFLLNIHLNPQSAATPLGAGAGQGWRCARAQQKHPLPGKALLFS